MALRLLGRKLIIVMPPKPGFYFRNGFRTENQDLFDALQEQDWLKEKEVPRLKKENCQLIERLKSVEEILISDLHEENRQLKERLKQIGEDIIGDLQRDTQKLEEASRKIEEMNKVGENLRDILSEERKRQDIKKENLRTKLKDDASNTINGLFGKVTRLEQTVFGDLHNEKDRCKSLETKLDKALRENEQMDEELERLRGQDDLMDETLRQNKQMNEELERLRRQNDLMDQALRQNEQMNKELERLRRQNDLMDEALRQNEQMEELEEVRRLEKMKFQ